MCVFLSKLSLSSWVFDFFKAAKIFVAPEFHGGCCRNLYTKVGLSINSISIFLFFKKILIFQNCWKNFMHLFLFYLNKAMQAFSCLSFRFTPTALHSKTLDLFILAFMHFLSILSYYFSVHDSTLYLIEALIYNLSFLGRIMLFS